MDFFFSPKSVAVIGASPNPLKGGNSILRNLISTFKGKIYPVNPKYKTVEGLESYPSAREIPGKVDTAIIFVPAKEVLSSVRDCAAKGILGVIIESAGFAETGQSGAKLQEQLLEIKRETGIRLWGPNCMGLVDGVKGHVFSFMVPEAIKGGLLGGHVSLIVQSGMLSGGFLMDIISNRITGINKVCSVGNKIDVDECDLMEYMEKEEQTRVIGMYLESIVDGRRFIELCRRSSKPIVVLKGGKSASGAQAAISHTAALAGNNRIIEGALNQAGVIEARDFKQMVDICRCLAIYPRKPAGSGRVSILTASGGAGIVATDFIEEFQLSLADFSDSTRIKLQKLFPEWMPVNNPVDIWPAIEHSMGGGLDVYREALDSLIADSGVDAILICGFAGNAKVLFDMAAIAEKSKKSGKPVFIWLFGLRDAFFEAQKEAISHGVPIFQELERAMECLAKVLHQKEKLCASSEAPAEAKEIYEISTDIIQNNHGHLDEYDSKKILRAHGIDCVKERIAATLDDCLRFADEIGYPLVMKGIITGDIHKTEKGLVYLGISDGNAVKKTYEELTAKMEHAGKVLLQKQVTGKIELIAGMLRDPHFGPCVMFGLGGIMAEAFNQSFFALAPLSPEDALKLIERFPAQKIFDGFRGNPSLDRKKFAEILVALGNIGLLYPGIKEIDVNPLIVTPQGPVAVDAAIILG
ncbi:MAG TPA: CoA-binding protein [Deltaproteobacteria bacterium]|nr:CoA-binding protein [Deltaproteobacteria bacterium]